MEKTNKLSKEIAELNNLFVYYDSSRFLDSDEAQSDRLIYAEYWPRLDLDPERLLPRQWQRLPEKLGDLRPNLIPADVVIAYQRLNAQGPIDFKLLRGALVLFDKAAYIVNTYCFHLWERQWVECIQPINKQ